MDVNIEQSPELFFVFFVLMWFFISFILSRLSGWNFIAQKHPQHTSFIGDKFRFQSMKMGMVNYSNCLTLGANSSKLFMGVLFPFRFGHNPIVISLCDVSGRKSEGAFMDYVVLTIESVEIKIPQKLADKIVVASNGNWNYSDS